jgi:pilus assembly protein Flp/PilA
MRTLFKAFAADVKGATAIEYGLIAALIAVVIITGLTAIGTNLNTSLGAIATDLR